MPIVLNRRVFLALINLLPLAGAGFSRADETVIELSWEDLVPDENGSAKSSASPFGIVKHGQLSTPIPDDSTTNVTQEFDGKTVRIPGFVVPLQYKGTGTNEFLLVPYVGACIHVPPPPANQLVFVTSDKPYELRGLFEAVYVTGTFGTAAVSTQLAEAGYVLSADRVSRYE